MRDEILKLQDHYGAPPQMIVIDTLARNFGAGNENSTEDMNRFVASIDRYLREEFGSAIVLVHHTGHDAASRARELGMGFVGINSNDPIMYESDNWDSMVKRAGKGMSYSYLHDESQTIANAYGAERTPEFYLLDSTGTVVYRGRMDDSPRNPMDATTDELGDAMSALAAGDTIANARTDSIGCSVKWK